MKYTVYSKPACPFCDKAKMLLKTKGLDFEEIHLDVGQAKTADAKYISRDELLAKIPTARTMPQIFAGEQHLGGFTELQSHLS